MPNIVSGIFAHIENGYFKPHILTSYSKNNKFLIQKWILPAFNLTNFDGAVKIYLLSP